MQLSPNASIDDLYNLSEFFGTGKTEDLPVDIDKQIATIFGISEQPFTTSMDAAYSLLEAASADEEYVNVDFREYRDNGYVICDINHDYGGSAFEGSGRNGANRIQALVGATINACIRRFEIEQEEED